MAVVCHWSFRVSLSLKLQANIESVELSCEKIFFWWFRNCECPDSHKIFLYREIKNKTAHASCVQCAMQLCTAAARSALIRLTEFRYSLEQAALSQREKNYWTRARLENPLGEGIFINVWETTFVTRCEEKLHVWRSLDWSGESWIIISCTRVRPGGKNNFRMQEAFFCAFCCHFVLVN